jgi:hypothetical protein
LESFITSRVQPDGTVVVTPEDVDEVLEDTGSTVGELRAQCFDNFSDINAAEQQAKDQMDPLKGSGKRDDKKLKTAIERAEKKQKDLNDLLKSTSKGVNAVLGFAALAVENFGDAGAAGGIRECARE